MRKTSVTFVDVSEVYEKLGFTDYQAEQVDAMGFSNVSYGDAFATLVGNRYAWACIADGWQALYPDQDVIQELAQMQEMYWDLVGQDDYINLES